MTPVAFHDTHPAEDWETDTATTTDAPHRSGAIARTVEPERKGAAPPRAVRLTGDRSEYIAWLQVRNCQPDVRVMLDYDLELRMTDELTLNSESGRSTSDAPESVSPIEFVYGAGSEPTRQPRTELWKRLMEIRSRAVAAGTPLLDWDGLERELRSRRSRELPGERG